jgi:hypothetical protein
MDEGIENQNGSGPDNDNKRKYYWQVKEKSDPPHKEVFRKNLNTTNQARKEERYWYYQ